MSSVSPSLLLIGPIRSEVEKRETVDAWIAAVFDNSAAGIVQE